MMSTGVRTPVGVRVVAADPARLDALGGAVEAAVRKRARHAQRRVRGARRRAPRATSSWTRRRWRAGTSIRRAPARSRTSSPTGGDDRRDPGAPSRAPKRPLPVRLALDAPWLHKPPQDVVRDATVRAGRDGKGQPVPLALPRTADVVVDARRRCARSTASCAGTCTSTSARGRISKAIFASRAARRRRRARTRARPVYGPASASSGSGSTSCSWPDSAGWR